MSGNKSFYKNNPVNHQGITNTWFTPKEIINSLCDFDLDPCTQSFRPFDTAKNHYCEDNGDCGLTLNWFGKVWLNPPYGKEINKWLLKLQNHGNGIALVFSRTETKWSQNAFNNCDGVFFIEKRISFIRKDGSKSTNAANGSMFLIYGKQNIEIVKNSKILGTLLVKNKQ